MPKETVGNEKAMRFTPGYGHISVFDSLLALGRPHTSLSGLRTLVPSALNPSSSTTAFHTALLLYLYAISCAFRWSLFIALTSAPASRSWEILLLSPPQAAQCNAVKPLGSTAFGFAPNLSRTSTDNLSPCRAAQCRGVRPILSLSSTAMSGWQSI